MENKIIQELERYHEELKNYQRLLELTGRVSEKESVRESLVRKTGALKEIIIEVTNKQYATSQSRGRIEIWSEAFNTTAFSRNRDALTFCINAVNEAIGKLESDIKKGIRDEQGDLLTKEKSLPIKTESPIDLFDAMQFHQRIIKVSRKRFESKNYEDAIYRAFVEVNNFVKEKSCYNDDGKSLMSNVFNCKNPLVKLNPLISQSDTDEQEGFMHLFMGAMQGIRNPKAHENLSQRDPIRTLEYLSFANLLMRRVEEGKVVKPKPEKKLWNSETFLVDAGKRCISEKVEVMKKLIDFTKENSDAGIFWGSGAKFGSFVFKKLIDNKAVSIFQIYTDGTLFIYFQPLKNKGITEAVLYRFRLSINKIPGVNIAENIISEKDKYGSLSINLLINPSNLDIFKEAVISLCKDIDFIKEQAS